jgi:hypothetical protein
MNNKREGMLGVLRIRLAHVRADGLSVVNTVFPVFKNGDTVVVDIR